MLRPVDIGVALEAALTLELVGRWAPADIRHNLGLPRATLSESLDRLAAAGLVRDRFLHRGVLASLLPVLPHIVPIRSGGQVAVQGLHTGFAAPAFAGQFRAGAPLVWAVAGGPDIGLPIDPLHPRIPAHLLASGDEQRYAMLAWVDAVRGGRAREVAHGIEGLRRLCGLPPSPGIRPQPAIEALMGEIVDGLRRAAEAEDLESPADGGAPLLRSSGP